MPAPMDFTDQRFGRLVAIRRGPSRKGQTHWLFSCDCGVEKIIGLENVRRGVIQSCGCLAKEQRVFRNNSIVIHGKKRTPEYAAWRSMKARCLNPDHPAYACYGARGITVCERWMSGEDGLVGFQCFLADMGERPAKGYTLDREDNEGNYHKDNCRWATPKQQARNRRSNRTISAFGRTLCLSEAAELHGIHVSVLAARLGLGWEIERALTQPVRPMRRQAAT